jgi:hypothetical protein
MSREPRIENGHPQGQPRTRRRSGSAAWIVALTMLLVLGSWLLVPPIARAQEQPPDVETYALWLREASAATGRGDRLGLEDVARRLTATTRVRLPGGDLITVDNGWLRDALADAEPDMDAVGLRLGAILDALALPASAAPANSRERLRQLLDQPPFKQAAATPPPSWVRDFFDWLGRLLEQLLRPAGRAASSNGRPILWLFGILGALLLFGVIAYLVRGLRRGMVADASATDDDPEANLTAKTALDQAGGLARGGDYRAGVRFLYLSALLWLDERNILRYDRALTNREYLERVRDNQALRARMVPIVDTFDRVWYGHMPIDAAAFAAYQRQIEELRSQSYEF